jgi:hypothetical protein
MPVSCTGPPSEAVKRETEGPMCTKSTIAYSHGPDFDFHFFHEVLDDDGVYLELAGADVQYEAGPGRVLVRIPVEIWEVIRQLAPRIESVSPSAWVSISRRWRGTVPKRWFTRDVPTSGAYRFPSALASQ